MAIMEVGTAVRTAFLNAISALTYQGKPITIFDEFETLGKASPYCMFSTQTEQQVPCDDAYMWNCTILLKIMAYGGFVVGKKAVEDLGNLILQNVLSQRGELINTVAGFDITGVQLIMTNTAPFVAQDKVYITKMYRFGMTVQQF